MSCPLLDYGSCINTSTLARLPPAAPCAAELASLRAHREWADRRIAQLIRRVGDAERPVREEAARLLQEVQALRVSFLCPPLSITCARLAVG